jgi:uncharacterized protein (TIGR00725 family)
MSKILVGVLGPGAGATAEDVRHAYALGELIAQAGWVLVTGGRAAGVMDAASRGAQAAGGLTVGILPTSDANDVSAAVDIAIITGMGQARNNINVLTCAVVIACGLGAGTAAEIALALKAGKHVILLGNSLGAQRFFAGLGRVQVASTPGAAVALARQFIAAM